MFVKKLVEKATRKPTAAPSGLRPEEVDPRLVFHYGIPAGSNALAYDPLQRILAISTADGRIKLFGTDNTQALLESVDATPSKFLQVWNISKKQLMHVHIFQGEITSFMVIQQSPYMYVGHLFGNVSVLKLDKDACHLVHMQYNIPFAVSHGF